MLISRAGSLCWALGGLFRGPGGRPNGPSPHGRGRHSLRYPLSSSAFPQSLRWKHLTRLARNASLLNRIETSFYDVISAVDKNF